VLVFATQQRMARCAYVPLLAEDLLPNADLAVPGDPPGMPLGWSAAAPGVQLGEFAVDGDRRSLQLIGIANYVQTPPVPVQGGQSYCFTGLTMSDSHRGSTPRLQVGFHWLNQQGEQIAVDVSPWQSTVLWQPDAQPDSWATLQAAFRAPADAARLLVRVRPSSDDRVYLDAMQVRQAGIPQESEPRTAQAAASAAPVVVQPWPNGKRAALSFSFDWETAMGGLVHSRSVNDPNFDEDPVLRGMRMREGVTTTLAIFRPHGIRATYYATGYNFLHGNTQREQFMGNPTYAWANSENRWLSDRWQTTPWFAPDPYGTAQSHPAWYFGDLVPLLQRENQDIQSHTFSHFYGGFVTAQDWRDDLSAWSEVAARRRVPPVRSLAFPWSSSGGMSEANWETLKAAGLTSVTRLSDQSQYNLFPQDEHGLVREPRCIPLPGHAQLLACPDFYLTPASEERALQQIERVLQQQGVIDLWAHTEEVVSAEQRATWQHVVNYAAAQPDLWIAPLREITDWQHALSDVTLALEADTAEMLVFQVANQNRIPLRGLTLRLPFVPDSVQVEPVGSSEDEHTTSVQHRPVQHRPVQHRIDGEYLIIDIPAQQTVEVQAWRTS
jgi:hypothetical protein